MKRLKFFILFIIICLNLKAQFYQFDSIPSSLKKSAIAVVRSEQGLFTIRQPGDITLKFKKAVTLLNDRAALYRYQLVLYDKYSRVKYLRGAVYDEKGKIVKALGLQDVFDMSAITGASFYSDDRMKVLYFPLYKYPYTIEYEYEISYSSIPKYPDWSFQDDRDVSVEKSGIQYVVPVDMKLRYFEQSLKNKVDSVVLKDQKIYTWQETNLPALSSLKKIERSGYTEPVLYTAPVDFEYGGFKGSMSSWKAFGEWQYSLNKNRDALPDEEISAIKSMVSKYPAKRDLIKAVYEYVQSKTRYVSIQIGIGGFQTAEAAAVSKNGFGDCKALVNYTKALLKVAGIESFYTLVKAGTGAKDINTGFVDNQFNHVILCVPVAKDTIWLECTNQNLPFNYLGSFTCDRHVLLITPEGGRLVKTPGFSKDKNKIHHYGNVFINILGNSSAKMGVNYYGYYFGGAGSFAMQSEKEMKSSLYSSLDFPDYTITSASYSEKKSEDPEGFFKYNLDINGFGITRGERIYFSPSFSKEEYLPYDTVALKIPVGDITTDSITYFVPLGYQVESMPENVLLESEFGKYSITLEVSGDNVLFQRRLELNSGEIPLSKYYEFRRFINSAAKADRGIIVLLRSGKTSASQ